MTRQLAKHIRLDSPATLDDPTVRTLMQEATARAAVPLDPRCKHRLIMKTDLRKTTRTPPCLSVTDSMPRLHNCSERYLTPTAFPGTNQELAALDK
jgi:hypothetical protein